MSELPARRLKVNGLSLHVVDAGEGPAVVLLHGFPDSSQLWRHQIPALVAAGRRVIAPDLRGFGESDRPDGVDQYSVLLATLDVVGVIEGLDEQCVAVVGHDWGAAVAWTLATLAPDRVDRLVAISVGHPAGYVELGGMEQLEKGWYMFFFQFEGVAEEALQADDWRLFRQLFREQGDVDRYVRDLSRPGALTAALNWYRANVGPAQLTGPSLELPPVRCPVLGIWSDGDHHCVEAQMAGAGRFVEGPWRYERVEGAGHWLPVDAPDRLNGLLLDFLAG